MERAPSFSVSFYLPANILKPVVLYLQRLIITTREALYNIPEEEKKKSKMEIAVESNIIYYKVNRNIEKTEGRENEESNLVLNLTFYSYT